MPNSECRCCGGQRALLFSACRKDSHPIAGLKSWPNLFESKPPREQVLRIDSQCAGEKKQLAIRHAPSLQLKVGQRIAADAPAAQLQSHGELLLRPALLRAELAHLWADEVQPGIHQKEEP